MSAVAIPALDFLRAGAETDDPPVTVIREIHVALANRAAFERQMGIVIQEATRQPGHLGATVVRPHLANAPYQFIYKFDRRSSLEAWHLSDLRARLFASVEPLIQTHQAHEYVGLETWFEMSGPGGGGGASGPAKWKVTLLSWVAIYPSVVVGSYVMQWLGWQLSIAAGAFVLTAVVVPIVAYVLAPALGKLMHRWLMSGASRGE